MCSFLPFPRIIENIGSIDNDLTSQNINFDLSACCPIGVVGNRVRLLGIHPIYNNGLELSHHSDVIMSAIASQITSVPIVCLTVWWGADKKKHQRSASLAFVRGIHQWAVNSPHKGPVTQKMCPISWRHHETNTLCPWRLWDKSPHNTVYFNRHYVSSDTDEMWDTYHTMNS